MSTAELERLVIERRLRVPVSAESSGDSSSVARQLDVALLSVGFKASPELLRHIGGLHRRDAVGSADIALSAVRGLVGDHVEHNVYFRDFPRGVPDTVDFWNECIAHALEHEPVATSVREQLRSGFVNLLSLPEYGRYQHSYDEMLAAHEELIPDLTSRFRVISLGGGLDTEVRGLYADLAGSPTPLADADAAALLVVARHCVDGPHPDAVPVRENRALLNRVAVEAGRAPVVDTVTDVLRLAAALADGDHVLRVAPRFPSYSRPVRRALLRALDDVVGGNPAKLADVHRHREIWKRLGERLHAGSYPELPHAARVFAVARGQEKVTTLAGRIEAAFESGDVDRVLAALLVSPGTLVRSADRTLRSVADGADSGLVVDAIEQTLPDVAGRLVLSLREHLLNRSAVADTDRVFVNRSGGGWVAPDRRPALDPDVVARLASICDTEITRRIVKPRHVLVDPDMLDVAIPLSGRASPGGIGVLPRGSRTPVDARTLRFFVHWKQASRRTDLDLSCLLLDADFTNPEHVSWTRLSGQGFVYSGDITEAPNGASEFLDVDSTSVGKDVVVPQVLVYAGERFDELEEGFFGYMDREPGQKGQPFEPRTVRMKSALAGGSRVVIPLVFVREGAGWTAVWLHLEQRGRGAFNTVEAGRASTTSLVRSIVGRRYVTVRHLLGLLESAGAEVRIADGQGVPGEPVTFIGLEPRDDLAEGSVLITPENLGDLVPM